MVAIRFTDPEQTRGVITLDDGREVWTVLPPEDGEMLAVYDRFLADRGVIAIAAPAPAGPPDNPTLSDWRVGLTLWKRADGTARIDEVTQKVADLVDDGHPMGRIARERLEYANNVLRAQLMQLRAALGFSEAEVDESLWRAAQVTKGDLSGVWPLPAA